jgi:hypothetical protein
VTLDLLDAERVAAARADLASELIGICARYENVKELVVYPALRVLTAQSPEVDQAERDQRRVRDAMGEIRRRTQHIKPTNVHADDPEGFEQALHELTTAIRVHVEHEDSVLLPMLSEMNTRMSDELCRDVEHAVAHASTHPNPPRNRFARTIVGVEEWIERELKDESTSWHPGVEKLHQELASPENIEGQ